MRTTSFPTPKSIVLFRNVHTLNQMRPNSISCQVSRLYTAAPLSTSTTMYLLVLLRPLYLAIGRFFCPCLTNAEQSRDDRIHNNVVQRNKKAPKPKVMHSIWLIVLSQSQFLHNLCHRSSLYYDFPDDAEEEEWEESLHLLAA